MKYHLSALLTVTIWSITFISSKVVLAVLTPLELTLYRFVIGYLCLVILRPPKTFKIDLKSDKYIILSAFLGIFLYYIAENSATNLTQASYVSIIVSTIPLITSVLAHFMFRDEKFKVIEIITFVLAFSGVGIIIFEGSSISGGYFIGNLIALSAAIIFSFYNIFLKKIDPEISTMVKARKLNFYGLIFIALMYLFSPDKSIPAAVFEVKYLLNILFLGIIASSLCVLLWGYSVTGIGSVKTSKYIYLIPLITGIASNIILGEQFTFFKVLGMSLIIIGMLSPTIVSILRIKRQKIY